MHRSCRFLDFKGWNVGSGLRDRLATTTITSLHSFAQTPTFQATDGLEDEDKHIHDFAKKLEEKNQAKDSEADEDEIRQPIYRRTLSLAEGVLSVDPVRKRKSNIRSAAELRKMMMTQKKRLETSKRSTDFRVSLFSHSNPAPDHIVCSIEHQLRKADKVDKRTEKMKIQDSQLSKLEESDEESVVFLEDMEVKQEEFRPRRGLRTNDPLDLPLSRPNLQPFYYCPPLTNRIRPDVHFAEWFIGITEAQLPFKVDSNGRPYFALHHPQIQFLNKIKTKMQFGRINESKEIYYVKDDKHLPRIIHLLNGNLFLQRSRDLFKEWVQRYQDLGVWEDKEFVFKETCQWRPQLNNKWLMGWIDSSYGLFAGRIVESAVFPYFNIQLKFWLLSDDRSLLEHMKAIFGGGQIEADGDWLKWTIRKYKLHVRLNRPVFACPHAPAESVL